MNEKLAGKMQKVAKYVEQTHDEDYQEQLEIWAKQTTTLEAWQQYRDLPMTRSIVQALVKTVKNINRKLMNEKEIDRSAYLADKTRCLWLIKTLAHNYAKELKIIELAIDNEINELEI